MVVPEFNSSPGKEGMEILLSPPYPSKNKQTNKQQQEQQQQ